MSLETQLIRFISEHPESRYEIARRTGIAESILSRFVNRKQGITIGTANQLCKYLNLHLVKK